MSLLDQIKDYGDVKSLDVTVPMWGDIVIRFKGLTFVALAELQGVDMSAAQQGDLGQAVKIVQATAYDPETDDLLFPGPVGYKVLVGKSYEAVMFLLNEGANKVLGVDSEPGKDSSSTETETQTELA